MAMVFVYKVFRIKSESSRNDEEGATWSFAFGLALFSTMMLPAIVVAQIFWFVVRAPGRLLRMMSQGRPGV
jgi:hypothetical protein